MPKYRAFTMYGFICTDHSNDPTYNLKISLDMSLTKNDEYNPAKFEKKCRKLIKPLVRALGTKNLGKAVGVSFEKKNITDNYSCWEFSAAYHPDPRWLVEYMVGIGNRINYGLYVSSGTYSFLVTIAPDGSAIYDAALFAKDDLHPLPDFHTTNPETFSLYHANGDTYGVSFSPLRVMRTKASALVSFTSGANEANSAPVYTVRECEY